MVKTCELKRHPTSATGLVVETCQDGGKEMAFSVRGPASSTISYISELPLQGAIWVHNIYEDQSKRKRKIFQGDLQVVINIFLQIFSLKDNS